MAARRASSRYAPWVERAYAPRNPEASTLMDQKLEMLRAVPLLAGPSIQGAVLTATVERIARLEPEATI